MESRAPRFDRDPMSSIGIGGVRKDSSGRAFFRVCSAHRLSPCIVRALDVPSIPSSSHAIIINSREKKGEEVKTWPNSSR